MGFLGGSQAKSKSESGNHAWGWAKNTFGDSAGDNYNGSTNMLGNILGLGGSGASGQAMQDYWNSSGGQFLLNQGTDAITSKMASMGLAKSGAAMKGLEQYRQDLASTKLDSYLGHLSDLAKLGLGAGGLVVDAGQYSKGSSTGAGGGIGGLLGGLLGGIL